MESAPAAAVPATTTDTSPALACAGHDLVAQRNIPKLGQRPSGEYSTTGVSFECQPSKLVVYLWGADSAGTVDVPRERSMEVWDAWPRHAALG